MKHTSPNCQPSKSDHNPADNRGDLAHRERLYSNPEDDFEEAGKVHLELFITVHLTNVSKHVLAFDYDKDSRTGVSFAHRYEVRTSQGKSAQKRAISHPEIGSTGHGWPDQVVKPGESMDVSGDHISGLYDLSRPGEYTIQLLRAISDDPKRGFVKSNTTTVTVTK
jgi:hypothetical protein